MEAARLAVVPVLMRVSRMAASIRPVGYPPTPWPLCLCVFNLSFARFRIHSRFDGRHRRDVLRGS